MKKIFFISVLLVAFSCTVRAPVDFELLFLIHVKNAYEHDIKETGITDPTEIETEYKRRLGDLITQVKRQYDSSCYQQEQMHSFLTVAMVAKHGIPDAAYTDKVLARKLFAIVRNTSQSESLREIAEKSLLDYALHEPFKIPRIRSKSI